MKMNWTALYGYSTVIFGYTSWEFLDALVNDLVACLGKELDCTCSLKVPFLNLKASQDSKCTVPCDHREVCGEFVSDGRNSPLRLGGLTQVYSEGLRNISRERMKWTPCMKFLSTTRRIRRPCFVWSGGVGEWQVMGV